jgi:hypothetical protein
MEEDYARMNMAAVARRYRAVRGDQAMIEGAKEWGIDREHAALVQRILDVSREPLRVLVEREGKTLDRVFGFVVRGGEQTSVSVIPVERRDELLSVIDPEVRQQVADAVAHSLSELPEGRLRTVVVTHDSLFSVVVQLYAGGLA